MFLYKRIELTAIVNHLVLGKSNRFLLEAYNILKGVNRGMSNIEFFQKLQNHSNAKLIILEKYVVQWMRKIILNPYGNGKCLIIDGFAGKGQYDTKGKTEYGSPLLLLKAAIDFCNQARQHGWDDPQIYLLFIEYEQKNFDDLKQNIYDFCGLQYSFENSGSFLSVPNYPSINVALNKGDFNSTINAILDKVNEKLIPCFCFIDPFGFSQTPFSTISRFLKNRDSEILLNFIYEETNRFIKHENTKIQSYIKQHFGIDDLEELKKIIEGKKGIERKKVIVDFYSRQLLENTDINYLLDFEIKKMVALN